MFGALLVNFGSFTFLCAVACRGWKNGKVPKCAVGREGKNALCFHNISICAPKRVSDNGPRLKEVGAFELKTSF